MKRLHRMILRKLPGPFVGWLGVLMFLFLMQFLMKYLPDIVGKGLPLGVIIELITYNLAYMVVLAVPMAALLASLMTFGNLASSNAYLVVKSAGISLPRLVWPVAVAGLLLTGGMMYFNNAVLPEANFRAKNLWRDVRSKKPGFQLQPGVFYNGLDNYSILVEHMPPDTSLLRDVTIYDYSGGSSSQATIKAERGRIRSRAGGAVIDFLLYDGEIHRPSSEDDESRYERMSFERYRLRLNLADFTFKRKAPRSRYRSDRTTPTLKMIDYVDSLSAHVASKKRDLRRAARAVLTGDSARAVSPSGNARSERERVARSRRTDETLPVSAASAPIDTAASVAASSTGKRPFLLAGLSRGSRERVLGLALEAAREARVEIDDAQRTITWESERADRYRVEIHKKISIAVACFIFMLMGAPLGLSVKRGSLGPIAGIALGIFLFYWITLVQGEKLADRGMLPPWMGMWIANLVLAFAGSWLMAYVTLDMGATPTYRGRLWKWLKTKLAAISS